MSEQKIKTSKTTPWSVAKFLLMMVGCGLIGAFGGAGILYISDYAGLLGDYVAVFLAQVLPATQWAVFLVLAAVGLVLAVLGKLAVRRVQKDDEDEKSRRSADLLLSCGLALSSANMILIYGLFGVGVALPHDRIRLALLGLPVLLVVMAYSTIYQVKAVSLIKKLNPEKNGDPLTFRFQKNWMESCDEAERMIIFQASYKSYRLLGHLMPALWTVTVACSMVLDFGIWPMIIITILWLCHTVSYQCFAAQLEHKKINQ